MENYKERIIKLKQLLDDTDYIIIGAGAGLSTAAGLEYSGEKFKNDYKEFIQKYNFQDLYTATFYPFESQEEKWAFWAKLIKLNRYNKPLELYRNLLKIVDKKKYFVITTNTDGQFENAEFDKNKIFKVQGDYSLIQCENACHNKLYNNKIMVDEWIKYTEDCEIPQDLVPICPVCGKYMDMNLRKDSNFVQDEEWYIESKKYEDFVSNAKGKKLLLIEIGVGFNTPGIIRFPFEQMTFNDNNIILVRINKDYPFVNSNIENKTITFNEDVGEILQSLLTIDFEKNL